MMTAILELLSEIKSRCISFLSQTILKSPINICRN